MVENNTVIVVGAGASNEVGLPTGAGLKDKIADLLDFRFEHGVRLIRGSHLIYDALRLKVRGDVNPYLHAAHHIRGALPQAKSIDDFLEIHKDDEKIELCGKLAIVQSVLAAEAE